LGHEWGTALSGSPGPAVGRARRVRALVERQHPGSDVVDVVELELAADAASDPSLDLVAVVLDRGRGARQELVQPCEDAPSSKKQ
jgi:hypothetical protein